MHPIVKAALICDYALTSADGKISAIGLFNNIPFEAVPNTYPRFFVVIIVALDAGDHQVRIGIVDPMGVDLLAGGEAQTVNVEMPGAEVNLMVDFVNFPFQQAGIFQVQLFIAGRLIHSVPLTVHAEGHTGFPPAQAN